MVTAETLPPHPTHSWEETQKGAFDPRKASSAAPAQPRELPTRHGPCVDWLWPPGEGLLRVGLLSRGRCELKFKAGWGRLQNPK